MKGFTVQAICKENSLWKVMRVLEETGCSGIMARPHGDDPLSDDEEKVARRINSNGNGNGHESTMIDATLQIFNRAKKPISVSEVKEKLIAAGYNAAKPHGVVHILKNRKLIKPTRRRGYYVSRNREGAG